MADRRYSLRAVGIQNLGGRGVRASHHVADFNTLDDLIAHASQEGATHVLHVDDEVHLYFKRRDGRYEKSEVWQKDGYWHTQGPGSRVVVARPPSNAQPIARRGASRHVDDYEAIDRRDRVIAGPFKHYGDAKDAAGPAGAVRFVPSRGQPSKARETRSAHTSSPTRRQARRR